MDTNALALKPHTVPTMVFIGVTTGQSSIMNVFPRWSNVLGLGAEIVGYDAPIHAPAETYRAIVEHIKRDPLTMGALVTTHKLDLLEATRDLFDELDPYARLLGEISCISKRGGRLIGHAKDPISSAWAWQHFVPPDHWGSTRGEVLCLGAGGAALAISVYAAGIENPADRPTQFTFVDRSAERLEHVRSIHRQLMTETVFEYVLNDDPKVNDRLMASLPAGSLVINATGMGKDRPGSPVTDAGVFPLGGLVWELNYRGDLNFMHQARKQSAERRLHVEDGWVYFLHGWTQVIAEVFDVELTAERFEALSRAAR